MTNLIDATTVEEVRANTRIAREKLENRGIETLTYERKGEDQKYILDTRGTENYPGIRLWGFIDYLVKFRGFSLLTEKSFDHAKKEKRALNRLRGKVAT